MLHPRQTSNILFKDHQSQSQSIFSTTFQGQRVQDNGHDAVCEGLLMRKATEEKGVYVIQSYVRRWQSATRVKMLTTFLLNSQLRRLLLVLKLL